MADNRPATVPTWATDTNFSSGPKTGSPTKVTPSGGALAQGDVPGQPYRSERHNWLWNLFALWVFYLSDLHNQIQFLNKAYAWTNNHSFTQNISLDPTRFVNYSGTVLRTSKLNLGTAFYARGAAITLPYNSDGDAQFGITTPAQEIRIPFRVPAGATIASVSARFRRASAGITVTMVLRARGKSGTGSSAVNVGSLQTDTGSGLVPLTQGGLSETASDDTWYWLQCTTDDAVAVTELYDATVIWADPGPRAQAVS